jgi:UPF0755 protein
MLETAPLRPLRSRFRHRRPRRRWVLKTLAVVLVLGLLAAAGAVTYYRWCEGASGEQEAFTLQVPEGASGKEVIDLLHDRGVIRCDLVSQLILRRRGLSDSFVAGEYRIKTNMTLDDALAVLHGPPLGPETVRFTVPEGYRLTQIAERAEEDLGISAKRFLALTRNGTFSLPPYLPEGTETLEGFLFPKTYEFEEGKITPGAVIQRLLDQFGKEVEDLPWDNAERLGVTPYEVVIIASMIERETAVAKERALVSAVIFNRLDIGMTLGIDATLQYEDPTPEDGTLTESDLQVDSPYNTRLNPGLPPTPIASPRLASILAALEPADVDYLFFVACPKDGKGHHRFTVSQEEHINNTNECLG